MDRGTVNGPSQPRSPPERSQWGQLRGRLNKEGAGEALRLICKLLTYLGFLCPPGHLVDIAILY